MTGKEVRDMLISKGFILAEVAEKLNISAQTLNSRFNAKNFKVEYLNELSNLLGIEFSSNESISELQSIIGSQQKTIESLSRTIEKLVNK